MTKSQLVERFIRKIVRQELSEATSKMNIEQPVSNLYIKGWGLDVNGNMTIKIGFPNDRGFAIQTNDGLKETDYIISGKGKAGSKSSFTKSELETIGMEVTDYVKNYGSKNQKSRLIIKRSYINKF